MSRRRTERQLHSRPKPHHRASHDVSTGMAQNGQRGGIFIGQKLQRDRPFGRCFRQWAHHVRDGASDDSAEGRGGQARTNLGGHVERGGLIGVFDDRAVGQANLKHEGNPIQRDWTELFAIHRIPPQPTAGRGGYMCRSESRQPAPAETPSRQKFVRPPHFGAFSTHKMLPTQEMDRCANSCEPPSCLPS